MKEKLMAACDIECVDGQPMWNEINTALVDFAVTTISAKVSKWGLPVAPLFAYTVYGTRRSDDARMAWLLDTASCVT